MKKHIYYRINTYGCQMNVHESEKLAGILDELGYTKTNDESKADIIIFNTCCVRDNAEHKAIGNISAYKNIKKLRPDLILIVLGCMTQQGTSTDYLYSKCPYVDIVLGTFNKYDIESAIKERLDTGKRVYRIIDTEHMCSGTELTTRDSNISAWINIIQGCNNFCSYCIVPYVRGREESRTREEIVTEFKQCLNQGYKEITLLGQNVNSYGLDLDSSYNFSDLLQELASFDGKYRINYMTSHPKDFNTKVVDIIKEYDNISNYIHLPIQSGSNKVLDLMNRRYTREKYLDIIDYIKQEIPTAGITTDIMVGFPYEEKEDFEQTLDIIRRVEYSNSFMFVYSPRIGTPASKMPQVEDSIKSERINELVSLQRTITRRNAVKLIGSIQEVLVEDNSPRYENMLCGRTYNGRLVHFTPKTTMIGEFAEVQVVSNQSAALIGEELIK